MAIIPALDGLYHPWDENAAEDGLEKVILGITSPEEILDVASVE